MVEQQPLNYRIIWFTRRKLVYTVGLVVLCVGLIFLGIYPQVTESIALQQKYSSEEPKLVKLQAKLADLQRIDSTPEYEQVAVVSAALPSRKPLLEFLSSLNSVAVASNIVVGNFELSPGSISTESADASNQRRQTKVASVDTLDIQLEIKGTLDELQQFLLDIEKISPFTTITQLSLGKGASATDRETGRLIDAQLSMSTYFFTQSVKATIDAPLPQLTAIDRTVLSALSDFSNYDLPEQTEITGGGVQDPFGVESIKLLNQFGVDASEVAPQPEPELQPQPEAAPQQDSQ